MSEITSPIVLDSTGQDIVDKLEDIKDAIIGSIGAKFPIKITIVTPPTKTHYIAGEPLDITGLVVSAVFDDGTLYDVTDNCRFDPAVGSRVTLETTQLDIYWDWTPTGQTFTVHQNIDAVLPSWESGSVSDIEAMLDAYYNGYINIYDYWNIGEIRTVTLSAVTADDGSITSQQVDFVLSEPGGKTLATPIHGHTECAFQVDQVDTITGNYPMESTDSNEGGWAECKRRTWCNGTYRSAIPSGERSLFKQFKNLSGLYESETLSETTDYFALRAEVEVEGTHTKSREGEGTQVEWYETSTNRRKMYGKGSSQKTFWTFRSAYKNSNEGFVAKDNDSEDSIIVTANTSGGHMAPFGCI